MNRATHTKHRIPLDQLDFLADCVDVAAETEITYGEGEWGETHTFAIHGSAFDALTCAAGLLNELRHRLAQEVNPASREAWEMTACEIRERAADLLHEIAALDVAQEGVA